MADFVESAGAAAVGRSAAFGEKYATVGSPHGALSKRQFSGGGTGGANKTGTAVSGSEDFGGEIADAAPELAEAALVL